MFNFPLLIQIKIIMYLSLISVWLFLFPTDEITSSFRRFGHLVVDWPHKAESKSYFPPKGTYDHMHVLTVLLDTITVFYIIELLELSFCCFY